MAKKAKKERALTVSETQLAALRKIDKPTPTEIARIATLNATVKGERFSRLAKKRVSKALQYIGFIGNLSGAGYAYTPDQVVKVNALLTDAVKAVMARFAPGQAKSKQAEIEI